MCTIQHNQIEYTVVSFFLTCGRTVIRALLGGADLSREGVLVNSKMKSGTIRKASQAHNNVVLSLGQHH
jgi:hypothetical protein